MTDYQPIDCSLHDRYEAAAVRRQTVEIAWSDGGGERTHTGRITDIGAEDGAEFMTLDGRVRVRLDRISSFREEGQAG